MYNLLLVDDEPLIKVAFQSAVEWGKNGFLLAATASNGQEALHIVETQHIDAVITDLKMPGMDGLALIHELKKRSFIGPILVLSNYSDFDSVRAALTDGAYDYFLKINMNGESIGEHLEKMADLLRVQQQRQTEEDHRSFAIEAQKKENALIHCAQWVTSHCWVLPCFQSVLHAAGTAVLSDPAVYRHFNSRKNSSYASAGCCDRLNYRGFR